MIRNDQQLSDLLLGACLLATGGGCTFNEKKNLLTHANPATIIQNDKLDPNAMVCTLYAVGSTSIQTSSIEFQIQLGIQAIQAYSKNPLSGIFVGEIGSEHLALYAAGLMGIPVLDADGSGGRAVPEIIQDQFALHDRFTTPAVVVDTHGAVQVFDHLSPADLESVVRARAQENQDLVFVFDHLMPAKDTWLLNHGALARAQALGACIRTLQFSSLKSLGICVVDEADITHVETTNGSDFLRATVDLKGRYGRYTLFVQNENLVLTRNSIPLVTCPNLIMLMDQDNRPVHNSDLQAFTQSRVTILAARAAPAWQNEKGTTLFGPRHFGFPFDPTFAPEAPQYALRTSTRNHP